MGPDAESAPHKPIAEIVPPLALSVEEVLCAHRHAVWCVNEHGKVRGMIDPLECGVRLNFDCQEEVEELLQWIVLVKCELKKPSHSRVHGAGEVDTRQKSSFDLGRFELGRYVA